MSSPDCCSEKLGYTYGVDIIGDDISSVDQSDEEGTMEYSVRAVETILKYKFGKKDLLEQALTHPSSSSSSCSPSSCYERLEFVGDAALGLAICNLFYLTYPDLEPGQLSLLRAANISTEKLARVAVKHHFYKYIKHNAPDVLNHMVRDFVKVVREEEKMVVHGGQMKAPKVLADIVESVAGAIYIDCGWDLKSMWKVMRELLEPLVMLDVLEKQPQPITMLFELCNKDGKQVEIKHERNGDSLMERFDFENMLKAVERYKVTYMPVSPPLVVAMAKSELVSKYDLSSLLLIGCGGAPLGKEVAKSFAARFPDVEIVQGYGMTETGGGVTGMHRPEECDRHGSAGRLSSNVEAKIVDPETGKALSPMQQGELWLRGPMIMKGYVGNKEATVATLDSEGWLKTGDLCYFDSDGFLYIVDRLKELIKYKAYQVPPAELERYLHSIPEVADAAVIPYPDEEAGEIPMAYVVRRPGSKINEAQIIEIIAKQVSPYKKIRRVAFISSIPKSPAGKILRRELVKHALSGASKL